MLNTSQRGFKAAPCLCKQAGMVHVSVHIYENIVSGNFFVFFKHTLINMGSSTGIFAYMRELI